MEAIETIVFDMDGVLIDSEPLHVEVEREVCKKYGIDVPLAEWERFKGTAARDMYRYIITHFTDGSISADELIQSKDQLYTALFPTRVQPLQDALKFLASARACFARIGLTTSSSTKHQLMAFEQFGLHPYFDAVVTGDVVQNAKPHPEPYLKTLDKLGVPAPTCLVIEDSENGIRSARAAGCKVAGLTSSFGGEVLTAAGADIVFDGFAELAVVLGMGEWQEG
jgi:beta-phosphoglucomutase